MVSYSAPFADYSFSYDARNRQTVAFVGAIGTRWLINGLGQRIAQINVSVPEFFFVYDEAGHMTGKYDGGGNLLWETAWLGDLPVAAGSPAGLFYIAPDHLGAPLLITNAGGAAVWRRQLVRCGAAIAVPDAWVHRHTRRGFSRDRTQCKPLNV
jgi:uncharacterized protein RhaS with RHS repeats